MAGRAVLIPPEPPDQSSGAVLVLAPCRLAQTRRFRQTLYLKGTTMSHRRDCRTDALPEGATCTCKTGPHSVCPRHDPAAYADMMARHATDSISPVQTDRAAAFHNFGITR